MSKSSFSWLVDFCTSPLCHTQFSLGTRKFWMAEWTGAETNQEKLPYGMIIGDLKMIVEVDGDQYFNSCHAQSG